MSALLSLERDHRTLARKYARLESAASQVLTTYMPQFPDSRHVDDCLVALAAAVAGVETEQGCEYCGSIEVNPKCPACQGIER